VAWVLGVFKLSIMPLWLSRNGGWSRKIKEFGKTLSFLDAGIGGI